MDVGLVARCIWDQLNKAANSFVINVFVAPDGGVAFVNLPDSVIRVVSVPNVRCLFGKDPSFDVGTEVLDDGTVVTHYPRSNGDWLDAVVWACRRHQYTIPPSVSRLIEERDAKVRAKNKLKKQRARKMAWLLYQGQRIPVVLKKYEGKYRWYEADTDAELPVSGATVSEAVAAAESMWRDWEFRLVEQE